jgi:hypothetical protein
MHVPGSFRVTDRSTSWIAVRWHRCAWNTLAFRAAGFIPAGVTARIARSFFSREADALDALADAACSENTKCGVLSNDSRVADVRKPAKMNSAAHRNAEYGETQRVTDRNTSPIAMCDGSAARAESPHVKSTYTSSGGIYSRRGDCSHRAVFLQQRSRCTGCTC